MYNHMAVIMHRIALQKLSDILCDLTKILVVKKFLLEISQDISIHGHICAQCLNVVNYY